MSSVRRSGGFSLIELIACIVIMAVLAGVAGPSFFDKQPFAERGYASELVSALRAARQVALSSGCSVQVTLNPATGYQALLPNAANCTGAFTRAVVLTDGNQLRNTPPSGVVLNAATAIVFDPKTGGVIGAAPPALTVGTYSIAIDRVSGFVYRQ